MAMSCHYQYGHYCKLFQIDTGIGQMAAVAVFVGFCSKPRNTTGTVQYISQKGRILNDA